MLRRLVTLVLVLAVLLALTQVCLAQTGGSAVLGEILGQFAPGRSTGGIMGPQAGFWFGDSNDAPSTATGLVSFSAAAEEQAIVVHWVTASEVDLIGFNLYRAMAAGGTQERMNAELILSQGSPDGAAYSWLDREVALGQTYFYWLETVDFLGDVTRYGPVSATVNLDPPQPISPASGSNTCSPTPKFFWQAVDGAASYQIQVATDPGFAVLAINDTTANTDYATSPASALGEGPHYWRVLAQAPGTQSPWSVTWSFTIIAPPPEPLLSSPKDQAEVCSVPLALAWYAVPGATNYRVELDDDVDFASPEMAMDTQTTSHTAPATLPAGLYLWRVQGSNTCGDGPWSNPWLVKFWPALDVPSLQSPPDGAATTDTTPTFHWTGVGHAAGYRIEIAADAGFGSLEVEDSATGTSYAAPTPLAYGTHYWRIQALPHGSCAPSPWSAAWRLTIDVSVHIYLPLILR